MNALVSSMVVIYVENSFSKPVLIGSYRNYFHGAFTQEAMILTVDDVVHAKLISTNGKAEQF